MRPFAILAFILPAATVLAQPGTIYAPGNTWEYSLYAVDEQYMGFTDQGRTGQRTLEILAVIPEHGGDSIRIVFELRDSVHLFRDGDYVLDSSSGNFIPEMDITEEPSLTKTTRTASVHNGVAEVPLNGTSFAESHERQFLENFFSTPTQIPYWSVYESDSLFLYSLGSPFQSYEGDYLQRWGLLEFRSDVSGGRHYSMAAHTLISFNGVPFHPEALTVQGPVSIGRSPETPAVRAAPTPRGAWRFQGKLFDLQGRRVIPADARP